MSLSLFRDPGAPVISLARRALVLALGSGLVVGLTSSTATAAVRPLVVHASGMSLYIGAVSAVPGTSGAWAVGTASSSGPPYGTAAVMWRWSSSKWVTTALPRLGAGGSLSAVVATSASNAWALGTSGSSYSTAVPILLHWNGRHWTVLKFPTSDDHDYFGSMTAYGSAVFVSGGTATSSSHPVLLGYKGTTWTMEKLPRLPTNTGVDSLSATSASASGLWAIARWCSRTSCTSWVLKPAKSGWSLVSVGGKGADLSGLAALSSKDIVAVGAGAASPGSFGKLLIERFNGSSWVAMKAASRVPTGVLTSASMSTTKAGWAAGNAETKTATAVLVDRLKGSTWAQTSVRIPGKNALLDAFGGGSPSAAWLFATSYSGKVCASRATIVAEHWGGSGWVVAKTPPWTIGATSAITAAASGEPRC